MLLGIICYFVQYRLLRLHVPLRDVRPTTSDATNQSIDQSVNQYTYFEAPYFQVIILRGTEIYDVRHHRPVGNDEFKEQIWDGRERLTEKGKVFLMAGDEWPKPLLAKTVRRVGEGVRSPVPALWTKVSWWLIGRRLWRRHLFCKCCLISKRFRRHP